MYMWVSAWGGGPGMEEGGWDKIFFSTVSAGREDTGMGHSLLSELYHHPGMREQS